MPPARYAQRVQRLARVFGILLHHPAGLSVQALSDETSMTVAELRADLSVFMNRDLPVGNDLALTDGIGVEFLSAAGEQTVSTEAAWVRLTSSAPLAELGLEYFTAEVLGPLYRAASDLSALEPDNQVLAEAVARLRSTLLTGIDGGPEYGGPIAALLRHAATQRQCVRIEYWRAWQPGVTTRVVEPYRVVSTRRGFEVDAGPLDESGDIRTFLVRGIRKAEVLDKPFQRPDDVEARIEASRTLTDVRVVVPRDMAWVVSRFAERTTVTQADDDLEIVAQVLPPVAERVGLMMAIAGPDAFVVAPPDLQDAAATTARRLLAQHGLSQQPAGG
ncbi:MAG: WYL domain-containing protein [Jiangellales bacterium]